MKPNSKSTNNKPKEIKIKIKDKEANLITDDPKDIVNAIKTENGQIDFLVEW